jgi:hypothetical protein
MPLTPSTYKMHAKFERGWPPYGETSSF